MSKCVRYVGLWLPALAVLLVSPCGVRSQDPATDLAETLQQPVLAGIDSVRPEILLSWDETIPGHREETVKSRLLTVLELELRRNGIIVSDNVPNAATPALAVSITTLDDDGAVAYSYESEFWELGMPTRRYYALLLASLSAARQEQSGGSDSFWVTADSAAFAAVRLGAWDRLTLVNPGGAWIVTWEGAGGVATVGRNNLQDSLEAAVRRLAQDFANAYLAANPRSR